MHEGKAIQPLQICAVRIDPEDCPSISESLDGAAATAPGMSGAASVLLRRRNRQGAAQNAGLRSATIEECKPLSQDAELAHLRVWDDRAYSGDAGDALNDP